VAHGVSPSSTDSRSKVTRRAGQLLASRGIAAVPAVFQSPSGWRPDSTDRIQTECRALQVPGCRTPSAGRTGWMARTCSAMTARTTS
jgi:hypothetical protein